MERRKDKTHTITQEAFLMDYLPCFHLLFAFVYNSPRFRKICFLCNGMGLIFSPFHLSDDGIQVEIVSKDHKPRLEGRYITKIIGACKCLNGEIHVAKRKRVEPWAYIVDGAMDNNWDCVFQADYVAKGYNRIIKGDDNFKKNPHIERLVNNIMGKYGKE